MTMKRLVSLLLVVCMMLPCLVFAEQDVFVDESEVFGDAFVDEVIEEPVEEDADIVLPETEDLVILHNEGVEGPAPYRELVILEPTEVFGVVLDVDTVRLSWSPVAFATSYSVLMKKAGESEYSEISQTPADKLYYDATVTPGQVTYFRVQALNVSYDGDNRKITYGPQSETVPFITLKAPVTNDPRGIDDDSVRLSWSSVTGATTYEVEMASSLNGAFASARKDLKGTLCNVDNLESGKGYYFRVRAVRTFSSGEVFYSDWSEVECGSAMARPNLSVVPDGNNAVLTWSKCPGATGYIIYRKLGEGAYTKLAIVGDVTSYVDAGRTPGEVCYYFVYATCPVGDYNCFSVSSTTRYFTIVETPVMNAVRNTGKNEQTIDWTGKDGSNNVAGASHFLVYSSTEMDGLYTELGMTEAGTTTFVAKELLDGNTYYYKVRAVRYFSNGDVSYGPWSNIMSMPVDGTLTLYDLAGQNATLAADIAGGYVGDVFNWTVKATGGSGAYAFRWSLVPVGGGTGIIIKDFGEGYVAMDKDDAYLSDSCSLTLTDAHVALITDQKYAIQVEVRDSMGAVSGLYACGDTYNELTFVAPKPVSKNVNITMRAGETIEISHGIFAEAGDQPIWSVSNPTNSVKFDENELTITALENGYATILVTPARYKNDILIAYHITVGYKTLAINDVTPKMNAVMNNYSDLSWDIDFTGGRPEFLVNTKVYRDSVLVAETNKVEKDNGIVSIHYQPVEVGNYFIEVTITAADGQTATKRSAITKVVSYEPVKIVPSATNVATGTNVTWITTYNGNNTIVRRDYTLYRDGQVVSNYVGTNDFAFVYTPSVAGSYIMKVTLYEANGNIIKVTSPTVTVYAGDNTVVSGSVGTVNAVRVALRKTPEKANNIILRVDKGQKVTVIRNEGTWSYIDYRGTKGWMMSEFITIGK